MIQNSYLFRMPHILPLGVYLGFKFWMYYTWLVHVSQHVTFLHTTCILLATIPIWYCYLKMWLPDPGYINVPRSEKFETIISSFEGERYKSFNTENIFLLFKKVFSKIHKVKRRKLACIFMIK